MNSSHHAYVLNQTEGSLGLEEFLVVPDHSTYSKPCTIDTSALLFQHCPAILLALHLVYEVRRYLYSKGMSDFFSSHR